MKLPTITQLREAGWRVHIRHKRKWEYLSPRPVLMMKHEDPIAISQMQEAEDISRRMPGWYMSPRGGQCEVTLTSPPINGGRSIRIPVIIDCSDDDNYSRRGGRERGIEAALNTFYAMTGIRVTRLMCISKTPMQTSTDQSTEPFLTLNPLTNSPAASAPQRPIPREGPVLHGGKVRMQEPWTPGANSGPRRAARAAEQGTNSNSKPEERRVDEKGNLVAGRSGM